MTLNMMLNAVHLCASLCYVPLQQHSVGTCSTMHCFMPFLAVRLQAHAPVLEARHTAAMGAAERRPAVAAGPHPSRVPRLPDLAAARQARAVARHRQGAATAAAHHPQDHRLAEGPAAAASRAAAVGSHLLRAQLQLTTARRWPGASALRLGSRCDRCSRFPGVRRRRAPRLSAGRPGRSCAKAPTGRTGGQPAEAAGAYQRHAARRSRAIGRVRTRRCQGPCGRSAAPQSLVKAETRVARAQRDAT